MDGADQKGEFKMKRNFVERPCRRKLFSGVLPVPAVTLVVAGVVFLAGASSGAPPSGASRPASARRLPTPNGRVVYKMTNTGAALMSGSISMTWANYGQRIRQDTQMRMTGGPKTKTPAMNSWSVFDGQTVTMGMPGPQRRAMRMKVPPNYQSQMMAGGAAGMTGASLGKVIGRATILGKPCVIRTVTLNTAQMNSRSKIWMWQNLPLRTEMAMQFKTGKTNPAQKSPTMMRPMKMTMVATQLNTTIRPTAATFRIPAGYTIQNMGDMQKKMRPKPR